MKKLIFALIIGTMFASCGNSINSTSIDKDSIDTVQVDSLDSILVDTTVCVD